MDSITVLATVSSLSNMLNALSGTMSSTVALRQLWQDAGLTDMSLEEKLAALRTALASVKDWIEQSSSIQFGLPELHHQLIMDLDRCIACCRLFIPSVDASVSQLLQQSMAVRPSKFTLLRKARRLKKTQAMIQQQTTALTLLVTACNYADIWQQLELLEKPQTRRVFKAMEDDTSSLFVHRNPDAHLGATSASSSSLISSTSTFGGASRLLLKFDFDKQLFVSKVYERWLRGSTKTALMEQSETNAQQYRRPSAAESENREFENKDAEEKIVVDASKLGVVETQEKFSLLPPLDIREKFPASSTGDTPVETQEKFFVSEGEPSPVDSQEKYLTLDSEGTSSLASPLTPTSSHKTPIKAKLKSLRLKPAAHEQSDSDKRSIAIDNALKVERRKRGQHHYKAMLIGSEARLHLLTAAKKDKKSGNTTQEPSEYRGIILKNVRDYTQRLVQEVRRQQVNREARYFWAYIELLEGYYHPDEEDSQELVEKMDKTFFDALESVLQDPLIASLISQCSSSPHAGLWPKSAAYFFSSLSRISSIDYEPTQMDILYATTFSSATGNNEVEAREGKLSVSLLDIGGLEEQGRKWTHHFGSARFVVLVIDLEQCDEEEKMTETIAQLDTVVNSRWFAGASIILLLNINMAASGADLKSGKRNVSKAAKRVLTRFQELDRSRLFVSPCDMVASGEAAIQFMFSAIKESIIIETLETGNITLL